MTNQIIKRTGIFDKVDNIYGEVGAQYSSSPENGNEDGGGMPGGGGGAAAFGGDMDMGMPEGEDVEGSEGDMDLGDVAAQESGGEQGGSQGQTTSGDSEGEQQTLAEAFVRKMNKTINEAKDAIAKRNAEKTSHYRQLLEKRRKEYEDAQADRVPIYDKTFLVNEEIDTMSKSLDGWLKAVKSKNCITD